MQYITEQNSLVRWTDTEDEKISSNLEGKIMERLRGEICKCKANECTDISACFDGLCDGNKQEWVIMNEEYLSFQPREQLLLLFQTRKDPDSERTVRQQPIFIIMVPP